MQPNCKSLQDQCCQIGPDFLPNPATLLMTFNSESDGKPDWAVPAGGPASSGSPGSRRCRRPWVWTALSRCGPARRAGCSCSCPAAARPPGSPSASSPCSNTPGPGTISQHPGTRDPSTNTPGPGTTVSHQPTHQVHTPGPRTRSATPGPGATRKPHTDTPGPGTREAVVSQHTNHNYTQSFSDLF